MEVITSGDDDRINGKLYVALLKGEDATVFEICKGLPNGPFHILTIHHDTLLHVASFVERNNLVVALLRSLPKYQFEKLTWINGDGNTILHETATNNETVEAASEMLRMAPSLLTMTNKDGETPFFHAVLYGKIQIFKFLNLEVKKSIQKGADSRKFLLRNDKSTILHISVVKKNFDLAIYIAKTYPQLVSEEDGDGMTALQLLSCNPSAFDDGVGNNFFKKYICKHIDPERTSRVPMLEEIRKRKHMCESAKELARILIDKDKSWKATQARSDHSKSKLHKYKGTAGTLDTANLPSALDTPLLLATKNGCTEIVKEILRVYPQSIEHIDEDGRTIFHNAIKYRRMEIIEILFSMEYVLKRLRERFDKKGNSLLHMVSKKVKDQIADDDVRSPALVLRDDLILFERIKNKCPTRVRMQINSEGYTAEQQLIENNATIRADAKEWTKRTAENCSIVAVLIATVAFAAAYTVPGGPDQDTGYPLLKNRPFFIVFALADALSLTFSLTSVIIFLSILTSSFRLNDFHYSLHNKLMLGLTVLILSVSMMMVAFAATLILTISSGKYWTNIILYVISFFPVTVFVFSYVRLYRLLIQAFGEKLRIVKEAVFPTRDVGPPQADFTGLPYQALNTTIFNPVVI